MSARLARPEHPAGTVVERAVRALSAFDDVDRAAARRLLARWRHAAQLSPAQRESVVLAFPARVTR